jgi:hypothetical protein
MGRMAAANPPFGALATSPLIRHLRNLPVGPYLRSEGLGDDQEDTNICAVMELFFGVVKILGDLF